MTTTLVAFPDRLFRIQASFCQTDRTYVTNGYPWMVHSSDDSKWINHSVVFANKRMDLPNGSKFHGKIQYVSVEIDDVLECVDGCKAVEYKYVPIGDPNTMHVTRHGELVVRICNSHEDRAEQYLKLEDIHSDIIQALKEYLSMPPQVPESVPQPMLYPVPVVESVTALNRDIPQQDQHSITETRPPIIVKSVELAVLQAAQDADVRNRDEAVRILDDIQGNLEEIKSLQIQLQDTESRMASLQSSHDSLVKKQRAMSRNLKTYMRINDYNSSQYAQIHTITTGIVCLVLYAFMRKYMNEHFSMCLPIYTFSGIFAAGYFAIMIQFQHEDVASGKASMDEDEDQSDVDSVVDSDAEDGSDTTDDSESNDDSNTSDDSDTETTTSNGNSNESDDKH